jgi:hypothetical protein
MGAILRQTGEDKLHFGLVGARALWTQYSRRRAEGPSIDDEVLRRTCLDCAVDGTISGDEGGSRGYRGEYLEAVLRGKDSRVVCEFPRGTEPGTPKAT